MLTFSLEINLTDRSVVLKVEAMAVALSKCSKTVTHLRQAYPTLETNLKGGGDLMTEFLQRSSERLDNAWRRCKKLTGTLVTLKRLASVQEQGKNRPLVPQMY